MSDDVPEYEPTPEDVERWKLRDERVQTLGLAIEVERDMTGNPTLLALQRTVKIAFDLAIEELCETSPADVKAVTRLLVNIKTYVILRKTFEGILSRGREAERSLRDEDAGY